MVDSVGLERLYTSNRIVVTNLSPSTIDMKFFLIISVLSLMFWNIALSQSTLPECEGNNKNIFKFSTKHFLKVRKWTSCYGSTIGPKGEKYTGEFLDGNFHGNGVFVGGNGRKYVGGYKNHKRHGQGEYTYINGDKYIGEWKKHKYYGQGVYIYANGERYIGGWKKKKYNVPDNLKERNGKGTYFYINGDKYTGEWKNGLRHGEGTLVRVNKKIKKGIWKKDKLITLK